MAIRVSNRFKVTQILLTNKGGKKVTFSPVYSTSADPEYTTGIYLFDNTERNIEIYVPPTSPSINTFAIDQYYYMDFTQTT